MTTSERRLQDSVRAAQAKPAIAAPRGRPDAADPERGGPMHPVVYGSFSCPWSYLASQRTGLITDISRRPLWRMIAPESRLPVAGTPLDTAGRQRLQAELAVVAEAQGPGERLPTQPPNFLPNTGPAVAGYAEAVGAGVGDRVRELLFDAYWQSGADIGNPEILRRLLAAPIRAGRSTSWPLRDFGYAVSLAGGPITNDAYYRIKDWRSGWRSAKGTALPTLVDGGTTISGEPVLAYLSDSL